MKLQITDNFDQKLAELYSSRVTVNLDNRESTIDPNKFWNSMELIAVNHKAMINFRIKQASKFEPEKSGNRKIKIVERE